ncbi:MAG: GDP-mannose 4,6-dehydratase [Chloroflexi bacterium]|nr:GDP-mannose 4,6-dehydratase [Chloroflexota bacterium]
MRLLVTGIGGFAGSHLAEQLLAQGAENLWGVIHKSAGFATLFESRVHLCETDLRDPDAVHRLLAHVRPTHIYHLAGQAFVPTSWQDPWATLETNIRSELSLLQAIVALDMKPRLLVVSSNEVYGYAQTEDLPISETAPFHPANPYAVSKVAQDMLALQYHLSHQLHIVRVRPFNHIGPRQSDRFVAAYFARQVAEIEAGLRPPIMRVGNLAAQRDFTDVRDIARAYKLALERGVPGEAYNVSTGRPRAVQQLLDIMLGMSPSPIKIEIEPALFRPADVPISYGDASKLHEHTGWAPIIPFEQTVRDILDDWRARVASSPAAPPREEGPMGD